MYNSCRVTFRLKPKVAEVVAMLSGIEVHNLPSVMAEYDEHKKHTKPGGWDREEIDRRQTV